MKTKIPFAALALLSACAAPGSAPGARPPRAQDLPLAPDRSAALASYRAHPLSLFIHFGLYSAFGGVHQGKEVRSTYSEQIMGRAGIGRDAYMAAASSFDLRDFDADAVCRLAKEAGMTQIVATAKHHDGFCMFKTKLTARNIVDMGPTGRDPVGELAAACAKNGLTLGLYYSIVDWSEGSGFDWNNDNPVTDELVAYECAQLKELLTRYGPVTQLWFDMGHPTPAQSRRLAEAVWRAQPACAVNGRVWNEQGDFITLGDNEFSTTVVREPWQTAASIEHETWGYRSWIKHPLDAPTKGIEKARDLSRVAALGGCYLLNIGPTGSGAVDPYERQVLESLGAWMKVHGEAVEGARAVDFFGQLPWGGVTAKDNRLYLHIHDPAKVPAEGLRLPGLCTAARKAQVVGGAPLETVVERGETIVRWKPDAAALRDRLALVAVDLDGPPRVLPPLPEASKPGALAVAKPYLVINRNGAGYYQSRTPRAAAYDFRLAAAGEKQLLLQLGQPAAEDAVVRCRVTCGDKVLADRLVPVPARVAYLDLGRAALPADAALQVRIESDDDRPGSILPVAPGTLHLVDPAAASGPAALWQQL